MSLNKAEGPVDAHVLVVDDEASITHMIEQTIKNEGYVCRVAENGCQALEILGNERIDVVLSDIIMPEISGLELLKRVKDGYNADVMIMTGFAGDFNYETLVNAGASDFIQKPFSPKELILRLKRVLKMRYLLIERDEINEGLEASVDQLKSVNGELNSTLTELKSVNRALDHSYLDTIKRLCLAAEYKDDDTGDHIIRISRYSELIARKLGEPEEFVQLIRYASPMHDIGKIGIPDRILLKPGSLSGSEFETIKTHTTIGANILAESRANVLKMAHEITLNHHEKWDGSGYPNGKSRREIPLSARIVGVVDMFDALTSKRPYKNPYPMEVAIEIIRSVRDKQFDPQIVDVFLAAMDDIQQIKAEVNGGEQSVHNFHWSGRDIESGMDEIISRMGRTLEN